ncbi:like COV 2 [Actinidia rufa]|uniref:Like COV 2 n=1 Tax=Actinidia rufa TaxID=165716 RepID=A0A7J0D8Y9_9ERIC|nr:like COV 2 [Actinidia rufa]
MEDEKESTSVPLSQSGVDGEDPEDPVKSPPNSPNSSTRKSYEGDAILIRRFNKNVGIGAESISIVPTTHNLFLIDIIRCHPPFARVPNSTNRTPEDTIWLNRNRFGRISLFESRDLHKKFSKTTFDSTIVLASTRRVKIIKNSRNPPPHALLRATFSSAREIYSLTHTPKCRTLKKTSGLHAPCAYISSASLPALATTSSATPAVPRHQLRQHPSIHVSSATSANATVEW